MFLQQLFEAIDKRHAAFSFGRMNPPTLGHKQLADTVAKAAAGGDYFIFTSQTQDSKKNPLDYATKVRFLKALMPEHANHIVQDAGLKTIIQIAHWLYAKGYRSVTFVAGSDRIEGFTELLNKYNGVEGPNGFYKFDTISFASSGDRDPDGDGLAGISATAAREAAKAGNLEQFAQATGAGELAKPLYLAVRKGMLLEGLTEQDEIQPDKLGPMLWKLYSWFNKAMPDARIDIKQAGGRVWTRGDGTRYRDPARIMFKDVASRDKGFELLAGALKGARKTTVSGEFGSSPQQDALVWKGKVFQKYGDFSISIGSASRVTNPNSVWREKPVAESEMTPGELRDMYNYYVNVKGMSPEAAERLVYTRDEPLDEHIVKHGSGYRLVSKKTGKNLGDFPTKAAAKKHEREVQYFKHMGEEIDPKNTLVTSGIQIKFSPDKVSFYKGSTELYSRVGDYSNPTTVQINAAKGTAGQLAQRLRTPNDKTNPVFRNLANESSGYIPKNKKEAKDPRWSNALTVDVHPDTPTKNMKALKLI